MLRGLAVDLAIKKVKFDIRNKKNGNQNNSTKKPEAVKTKNKGSQSQKKARNSCRGAKYYLNRQTFAF
jgi:ribonuclease HI